MNKDIALVLASGGARGLAHIGVIEALEEEGFNITSIAGTSMGALVGGFYAAGKLNDYREWMKGINKKKIFSLADFSLSINHIVKGNKIIDALQEIVPDILIEDLQIPYCAVAAEWNIGKEVTFTRGKLYTAIRSSISIPSMFDPVKGKDMVLIDGGVINPLPLNRVARKECDLLVASDVSDHCFEEHYQDEMAKKEKERESPTIKGKIINKIKPDNLELNYLSLLARSSQIMTRQNSKLMRRLYKPDFTIDIPIGKYTMMDFHCSEELIALGKEYALERIRRYKKEIDED